MRLLSPGFLQLGGWQPSSNAIAEIPLSTFLRILLRNVMSSTTARPPLCPVRPVKSTEEPVCPLSQVFSRTFPVTMARRPLLNSRLFFSTHWLFAPAGQTLPSASVSPAGTVPSAPHFCHFRGLKKWFRRI